MARQGSQQPLNTPGGAKSRTTLAIKVGKGAHDASTSTPTDVSKTRQIPKVGEVNNSVYFPAEVKASLRLVQAKTGYNVKDYLADALRDLFKKHNVPVPVELNEGR